MNERESDSDGDRGRDGDGDRGRDSDGDRDGESECGGGAPLRLEFDKAKDLR